MELKKSKNADLEWRKAVFFQIGLATTLLLVLLFFEFFRQGESSEVTYNTGGQAEVEEQMIQTEQPKEIPPAPPEQTAAAMILQLVDNTADVIDITISSEADENLHVDEVVFVEDTKVEVVTEAEIFQVVEEEPEYPGGDAARVKFMEENIVYPKVARETGIEGTVVIGFVVEPNGTLTNFRVLRSKSPALDEEAMRVAKLMPKWKSGKQRGKAVRVQFQMPITFTLSN